MNYVSGRGDARTKVTVLGLALCQFLLEILDLLRLVTGRDVALGAECGLVVRILKQAHKEMDENTCHLFQLGVVFLRLDEVERDGEGACQDEGEEQTKPGEIHVPLCASRDKNAREEAGQLGGAMTY